MSVLQEIQPSYRAVYSVPMALITPGPERGRYDETGLSALASSIRRHGLLEPVTLRATDGEYYEIVLGERRFRACAMLGYARIDAFVLQISDAEAALFSLLENTAQQPLHFFELAERFSTLLEAGMDTEELAWHLGRSPEYIVSKLQLLGLPPETRKQVMEAGLSEPHAKALLPLTGTPSKRKIISTVWQPLLYLNAMRSIARQMEQAGMEVQTDSTEDGEWLTLNVKVRKRK